MLATLKYYLSGFKGKAPLYFSHNPIAGLADTVLFTFFATQAATGITMFLLHGTQEHVHNHSHGLQAASAAPQPFPEWLLILHLIGAAVIALFIAAHFTALGIHDVMERRGLTSSMISGSKFFDEKEVDELRSQIREKSPRPRPAFDAGPRIKTALTFYSQPCENQPFGSPFGRRNHFNLMDLKRGTLDSISEMIDTAKRFGRLKIYACTGSMAVLNIARNELIDHADSGMGLVSFLDLVNGADKALYI